MSLRECLATMTRCKRRPALPCPGARPRSAAWLHAHGALTAALLVVGTVAHAHDTWFEAQPATERGESVFALGTGNQFPAFEEGVRLDWLLAAACGDAAARSVPLRWMADQPKRLVLRTTRPLAAGTALSCVARLAPNEVRIDDPKIVDKYFDEARPGEAVRARWRQLREQGVTWQETYRKLARIMMSGNLASGFNSQGLDVRVENTTPVLRVGDTLQVQVLFDGKPLAGQMMELRSDLSPLGIWRQSDEQGRVSFPLALAARWLLRGINLRASPTDAKRWESDFITVALEVMPAAP